MQVKLTVTNLLINESIDCELIVEEKVIIGRYLESPVTLQGDRLSRSQFCLMVVEGALTIGDLSSNGTWLNGSKLKEKIPANIKPGDTIEVPGYHIEVNIESISGSEEMQGSNDLLSASESSVVPIPSWKRAIILTLQLLEPREVSALIFALASVALIMFFLYR